VATDFTKFATGKTTTLRTRRRTRRLHEGRASQPGIPKGPRNAAAVTRREERFPSATQIPTAVLREHEGRVAQPGVPGFRGSTDALKGLGLGLEGSINPEIAATHAYESGAPLTDDQRTYIHGLYGKPTLDAVEQLRARGRNEALKEPADLTNAILAIATLGVGSDLVGGAKAAQEGAEVAVGAGAKDAAGAAAEDATSNAVKDAFAKVSAKKAAATAAVKDAASDAVPQAVKDTAAKGEAAARAFADRTPQAVKTAAKVGAKGVTYPIRHPIVSPIALQVPTAFIQRKPGALEAGFTGSGNYAGLLNAVGNIVSPIPLAKEAITLPSTVIPSLYLTGKAGVDAATTGNTAELGQLLDEWRKTGLLPQLVEHGPSGALEALEDHPLYSGLELSGAANAAGRLAGAGLRATPGVHAADITQRPDVEIPGTSIKVAQGNYSPDALRQLIQRRLDAGDRHLAPEPGSHRARHLEKEAASRHATDAQTEAALHNREHLTALDKEILPRKWRGKRIDRASAEVVNLAVERIGQNPKTFVDNLREYKGLIDKAAEATDSDGHSLLNREELKRNRALARTIDRGIKRANPSHVVQAADSFIELQKGVLQEMVDLKLITPERAEMASAIPWARVHLGAKFGEPVKLYKDLEHEIKTTKRSFRREARAHLAPKDEDGREGGYVGSHRDAKRRLKTAESGFVQAERDLTRARTQHADPDVVARKTQIRDDAKKRIATAKTEVRHTQAALTQETRALAKEGKRRLEPLEAHLKQHRRNGERLLDEHGYPLSREDVHKEMAERGVDLPGFMTHRPPSPGDHYQPSFGGSSLEKGARTGDSVLQGKQVSGLDALVRTIKRAQGLVDRAHAWNRAVKQFEVKIPGIDTMAQARRVIEDPTHFGLPEGTRLMAVPRHPFAATKDEMEGALAEQRPSGAEELIGQDTAVDAGEQAGNVLAKAIDDTSALSGPDDAPATDIVFFPQKVGQVLRDDAQGSSEGLRAAQMATHLFKRAVLPFSVSFYIGNGFDNWMRTIMGGGANPLNILAGVKGKNALTPERQAQILAEAHYGSVDKIAPHRSIQNVVTGGGKLADAVRQSAEWYHDPRGGAARNLVRALPAALRRYTQFAFATNALISERLPELGLLGKQVREDIRATQGSWLASVKLSEQAIGEWAKGVDDPATRIKLQKSLEQTLGNYSQLSPQARRLWSNVVPFWTWMRSAYKYVYVTMPAHRSIQTAFLAAAATATKEERERYGLEKFGKDPLPSYRQGAIPLSGGGILPTSQYSSFGYASEPAEALSSAVAGQVQGPLEGLRGETFSGDKIEGEGNRIVAAGLGMVSSFIPGANEIFEQEGTSLTFHPHVSHPHEVPASSVQWERTPKETITVEKSDGAGEGGFGGGSSFGESWANRGEENAGSSFAESWADR
jgi:hypothetical protein